MTKATIQEQFERFHAANPDVYDSYIKYTMELLKLGHRRISPRFIMERIRWDKMTATTPTPGSGWHVAARKPFKINNNFSSRYARLLIARYPKLEKIFETRELKAK